MKVRFLAQQLPDGTISSDVAVICEKIREWNWLRRGEEERNVELITLEQMKKVSPPYVMEDCWEIPLGSIEFVEMYLKKMYGLERISPILIPAELQVEKFLGRRIAVVQGPECLSDKAREWQSKKLFIKSASQLKCDYTGVYDITRDRLPVDSNFFLSEPIAIRSEWRVFVWRSQIRGVRHYAGDPWLLPDRGVVSEMVRAYTLAPDAYTLDVAVCEDRKSGQQRTVAVEVHNFISCGLYGFEDVALSSMCIQGLLWELQNQPGP